MEQTCSKKSKVRIKAKAVLFFYNNNFDMLVKFWLFLTIRETDHLSRGSSGNILLEMTALATITILVMSL